MATRKKTEYKVKQQIVYPSQGVGVITEIFEKEFNGEKSLYYKIYIEVSDMVVMVPVCNAVFFIALMIVLKSSDL